MSLTTMNSTVFQMAQPVIFQPVIFTALTDVQPTHADICEKMQSIWQGIRLISSLEGNCNEKECVLFFDAAPRLVEFQNYAKDFCAVSMTSFDRQTFKGNVDIMGDKVKIEMKKGEAIFQAESNLKDFVEASWRIPFTTFSLTEDLKLVSIAKGVEGSFKIGLNPNNPNNTKSNK